jgi:hypothetical protein
MEKNNVLINDLPLVIALFMIVLVVGVGLIVIHDIKDGGVIVNCCNGSICSDTYYTPDDNLCHLSLCENNPLGKDCTYPGKNITNMTFEAI